MTLPTPDLSSAPSERPALLDEPRTSYDTDVPPVVSCANCGSIDCPGCAPDAGPDADALRFQLPWERKGETGARLITTARLTVERASECFSQLPSGEVYPALRFAVLCELPAVGSLVLITPAILLPLTPSTSAWLVTTASGFATLVFAWIALVMVMVGMHALWALSITWGARLSSHSMSPRSNMRFALYSCGWDFITSPLGLLLTRGSPGVPPWRALLSMALRAPSLATTAYLVDKWQMPKPARRRVAVLSLFVMGSAVLLFVATLLGLFILALLGFFQ